MNLFNPADRNPNGTWNGARVLARQARQDEQEITRQWKRIDFLRKTTEIPTNAIVKMVINEPKSTAWNAPHIPT
jgi:hypothetical protein